MPLEAPIASVQDRVAELNKRYRHHSASAVLEHALNDPLVGQVSLVSSFGTESIVLLHLLSVLDRTVPVLFLDTEMLFPETLAYQQEVAEKFRLSDVRRITPDREALFNRDPDAILHLADPDACCTLRKREPLERALQGFEAWITGRKRFQTDKRAALEFFEADDAGRIKINPLAHWSRADVQDYIVNNRLPRHPLASARLPSLGCMPCTSEVNPGEDDRSGRWRGLDKDECGIHFVNGRAVRGAPAPKSTQVIVTDTGFADEDWPDFDDGSVLDLPSDTDLASLDAGDAQMIRIDFPSFADGRGFTLARHLRQQGFTGRLRARGHVIADQYAMARRSGFDEVEISADLALRQPEDQWIFRSNWRANDYQARLRG